MPNRYLVVCRHELAPAKFGNVSFDHLRFFDSLDEAREYGSSFVKSYQEMCPCGYDIFILIDDLLKDQLLAIGYIGGEQL